MPIVAKLSAYAARQPRAIAHLTRALAGARRTHASLLVGGAASHAPQIAAAWVASLLCAARQGQDACGTCLSCQRLAAGNQPALHVLASNDGKAVAIAQVRALIGRLALVGGEGQAAVVHVPDAAALTPQAQQALLKVLEEPTGATTFVLVAARATSVLPTLRSRMAVLPLSHRDEAQARATLLQRGMAPHLADWAALQTGDDVAAAEALIDAGLGGVLTRLQEALGCGGDVAVLSRCAQDLGQNQAHFAMAHTGLALHLRDALLARLHAPAALQRDAKSHALLGHVATNQLCAAADALQNLLACNVANINRPLALEGLFLLLEQSAAS